MATTVIISTTMKFNRGQAEFKQEFSFKNEDRNDAKAALRFKREFSVKFEDSSDAKATLRKISQRNTSTMLCVTQSRKTKRDPSPRTSFVGLTDRKPFTKVKAKKFDDEDDDYLPKLEDVIKRRFKISDYDDADYVPGLDEIETDVYEDEDEDPGSLSPQPQPLSPNPRTRSLPTSNHVPQGPFHCLTCPDKTFTRIADLERHLDTSQRHNPDSRHPCPRCGKEYQRRDTMLRHRKTCRLKGAREDRWYGPHAKSRKAFDVAMAKQRKEMARATNVISLQKEKSSDAANAMQRKKLPHTAHRIQSKELPHTANPLAYLGDYESNSEDDMDAEGEESDWDGPDDFLYP